jgi:glycosyltransferase involved in cell wall biosynthesis
MDKVSVIITTYNRPQELISCVRAITQQVGDFDIEVCVVNDGGEPIQAPLRDAFPLLNLQVLELSSNIGQVAARNRALERANGDYIAICDDDDRFLPGHIAALLAGIHSDPEAVMAYTDTELVRLQSYRGERRLVNRSVFAWLNAANMLTYTNPIVPSSVLYRRNIHASIGAFDEEMSHYWDWDFWLRAANIGTLQRVGQCHTLYGVHVDGTNLSARPELMQPQLFQLMNKHGLSPIEPSNFEWMLKDSAFAHERASSLVLWDGNMDIWGSRN